MQEDHNKAASNNGASMRNAGLLVGAAAAFSLLAARRANALTLTYPGSFPGTGDIQVLNYALVLEELEAALYQAALAKLPSLGYASGSPLFNVMTEFAQVELDHAAFLRSAITNAGGPAVSQYQYDTSRIANATAARDVLELILQVEATGVRAYLGAIPLFSQASKYLQLAAAIQGTEARHTSVLTILRNQLFQTSTDVAPLTADNNLTGTFNATSFKYETYNPGGYNALKPNEGVAGIDANLSPPAVLTAISSFLVAPVTS